MYQAEPSQLHLSHGGWFSSEVESFEAGSSTQQEFFEVRLAPGQFLVVTFGHNHYRVFYDGEPAAAPRLADAKNRFSELVTRALSAGLSARLVGRVFQQKVVLSHPATCPRIATQYGVDCDALYHPINRRRGIL
jgi:hypothetical protein